MAIVDRVGTCRRFQLPKEIGEIPSRERESQTTASDGKTDRPSSRQNENICRLLTGPVGAPVGDTDSNSSSRQPPWPKYLFDSSDRQQDPFSCDKKLSRFKCHQVCLYISVEQKTLCAAFRISSADADVMPSAAHPFRFSRVLFYFIFIFSRSQQYFSLGQSRIFWRNPLFHRQRDRYLQVPSINVLVARALKTSAPTAFSTRLQLFPLSPISFSLSLFSFFLSTWTIYRHPNSSLPPA